MRSFIFAMLFVFLVSGSISSRAQDKKVKDTVNAADWLPDTTQGFARITDFPKFLEGWRKTQFGKLAKDERLQPFWKEQQKTIEARLADAGWQLNLRADDIAEIASGQSAIAWIAKPTNTSKPYAVALITGVAGKKAELDQLMQRVDTELKGRQATSENVVYGDVSITQYTLPRGAGEVVIHQSFYTVVQEHLIATDELAMMKELVDAATKGRPDSLSSSSLYQKSVAHLPTASKQSDMEYFIRPIGLAKLLRSISAKPITSQTDILKVLENQGFDKLAAAVGRVQFADGTFDIFHDAFIQTEPPLPLSVQVLDFPNLVEGKIPAWVTPRAASFLETAWNAKEAFWKLEGLVDEIGGQPGLFDSVIEGIQTDASGPQTDIKNQVLPFITPHIYSVSEIVEPITTDSRRTLIGIKISDPDGKLASALKRAMDIEPDAVPEDFEDIRIYKVTRVEEDDSLSVEGDFDFGVGKKSKSSAPKNEDKPLLSNWAITIFTLPQNNDQYLLFASHAETIKEAILLGKAGVSQFESEADVKLVMEKLNRAGNAQPGSMWEISRSDRAFRMQYELFRQDKLPQSQSMLATLLDRILRPKDELKNVSQDVKGDKLPPFDAIRDFLMPSGSRITTQPDGWSYQGFVLAK